MSITPQENLFRLDKASNQGKKQMFKSNKKLIKLSPISNNLQQSRKHKISICDNNQLLSPDLIAQYEGGNHDKYNESINQFISPSKKRNLFDNSIQIGKKNRNSIFSNKSKCKLQQPLEASKLFCVGSSFHQNPFKKSQNQLQSRIDSDQNKSSSLKSLTKNSQQLIQRKIVVSNKNIDNQELKVQENEAEKRELKELIKDYLDTVRIKIRTFLQSIPFQIFITVLTIFSLFIQDMRTIFISQEQDMYIDCINIFFLSAFFIEIMMSLTIQSYPFSFFFYLDLISTVSICMDITLITDIIYQSGGSTEQLNFLVSQSKASRAAARAVRIMKIFRLARVVKLYKSALKTRQINQLKQAQLLKKRLKARRQLQQKNSGFINQNFEGQTSQYKLSFTNNLSIKSKQGVFSQKSDNGGSKGKKNNFKNQAKTIRQNFDMIDKIHQQPQSQQGTQKQCKQQEKLQQQKQISSDVDESKPQIQVSNPLQISSKESNISKILSDSTIKKIIIVILIIMFSMTAMDITNYYPQNTSWDFLTSYVGRLLLNPDIPIQFINTMIQNKIQYVKTLDINSQVVIFQTPFNQLFSLKLVNYEDLRMTQIGLSQTTIDPILIMKIRPQLTFDKQYIKSKSTASTLNSITLLLSYKTFNKIDAAFSMAKIIFICLTIIYLLQSFNTNISQLVVTPIQKMLEIIINPEKKLQDDQQEIDKENNKDNKDNEDKDQKAQAKYETLIVQKAILKIRGLMSTIFGKVGMNMIYNQLFKNQNIAATNYLAVKRKTYSIYGYCRIQNFVQISQTLQNDTFTFVNQISHIVHSAVYRYGGYGVKNINDGFLVVFKLPEGKQKQIIEEALRSKNSKQKANTYLNIFSDYSIFSFVKMIVRLHKQPKLLQYKKDQRILQKFGNNFQIQMNFSIGIGQSIQGMVGSQFKIDPIYLGGKLDQIRRVSQVSQKYPNLIIVQKQLYDNLTGGLKNHCRIIDYVRLSEYDEGKTQIYAVDLDLQYISPSRSKAQKYKKKQDIRDIDTKKLQNMEILRDSNEINNYSAQLFITGKKQLRQVLRKKLSQDMKQKYRAAFQAYITGDWAQAKPLFEQILRILKQDVLSKRIYHFMAQRDFKYVQSISQFKSIWEL